jgi:hypothetical protein
VANLLSGETSTVTPKRVIETADPVIDQIFKDSKEDRVSGFIQNLGSLTLKQKVHGLLLLSDDEFKDFQGRRKGGAEIQLSAIQNVALGLVDTEDYIKAVSHVRDSLPRYEVEAEIRRRYHGQYPADWDLDLEQDCRFKPGDDLITMKEGRRLTYEQAVAFTKFENVRKWYRNFFFPQVTRRENPLPLTMATLSELFKQKQSTLFDPHKPGTDITIADLLPVLDYYQYEKEPDNSENCRVHTKVRQLAGIIKEMEEALEK